MALLKLKRIASDSKAKIIETDAGGFVLGKGQPAKYDIYDPSKEQVLHGIYPSEDFQVRNASNNPDVNSQWTTDFNIQGASGDFFSLVQGRNFALGIKRETLNGIANWNELSGFYEIEPELIPIYQTNTGVFDQTYFDNLSSPRLYLSGLPRAYISEIPLDAIYYDFDNGVMYADNVSMKNAYDYKYDVAIEEEIFNSVYVENSADFTMTALSTNEIVDVAGDTDRIIFSNIYRAEVYITSGNIWTYEQTLTANPYGYSGGPGYSFNKFGWSVAISGNYIAVGAPQDSPVVPFRSDGAVHIFENTSSWNLIQSFSNPLSSQGSSNDINFGHDVQMYNDLLIVPYIDDNAAPSAASAIVPIYQLSGGVYEYIDMIVGDYTTGTLYAPRLCNNTIVFSNLSDNTINIYTPSGSIWSESDSIELSTTTAVTSIDLNDDTLIVSFADEPVPNSFGDQTWRHYGKVQIFKKIGLSWVLQQELYSPFNIYSVGNLQDLYGNYISINSAKNKILVTAPLEENTLPFDAPNLGYTFIYEYYSDTDEWKLTNTLTGVHNNTASSSDTRSTRAAFTHDDAIATIETSPRHLARYDISLTSGHQVSITDTRKYHKIGIDKDDVWTAYSTETDLWYTDTHALSAQSELILPLNYEPSQYARYLSGDPDTAGVSAIGKFVVEEVVDPFNLYQHIERIKGFNRRGIQSRHKSNIFSIRIKNTNLNEAITDETLRRDIQLSIEKTIRESIKKITPANTQLWKIEWVGL